MYAPELFQQAVEFVLAEEGEHSEDPADPGGDTYFGISRRAYPTEPWPPTQERAIALYARDYWEAYQCWRLPTPLAVAVFDGVVQSGVAAVKLVQQAIGGVAVDGVIGSLTVLQANRVEASTVLIDFLARRAQSYMGLETFSRFGRGWLRRLFRLHRLCETLNVRR